MGKLFLNNNHGSITTNPCPQEAPSRAAGLALVPPLIRRVNPYLLLGVWRQGVGRVSHISHILPQMQLNQEAVCMSRMSTRGFDDIQKIETYAVQRACGLSQLDLMG